ncbi:MAG: DNA-directed polymerase specialized sigma subunit, sigma24 [Microbacterium sp.]|nr:DNA-directed polymerase specialized sigma subunit, sigma24 [Microbacterium sp.]
MSIHDGDIIVRSLTHGAVFADLYDRHERVIHRYVSRRLGTSFAEDVTSETFLVAFARRASFTGGLDARPWLLGIATVLMQKHARLEARAWRGMQAADIARVHVDDIESAEERMDADGLAPHLGTALAGLSRGDRDVLLLHTFGELDYAGIAEALGIPLGTVRSRLSRARRKIRAALAPHMTLTIGREREHHHG